MLFGSYMFSNRFSRFHSVSKIFLIGVIMVTNKELSRETKYVDYFPVQNLKLAVPDLEQLVTKLYLRITNRNNGSQLPGHSLQVKFTV